MKGIAMRLRKLITITAIITTICSGFKIQADPLTEQNAILAIIGEAADQQYRGMLAVACALRNRGTLVGVVGLHAKHVQLEPPWVWEMARKAWIESATNDITGGATFWENIDRFGKPEWAKKMHPTVRIKDHQFYRP
jgi:hypothetical protein